MRIRLFDCKQLDLNTFQTQKSFQPALSIVAVDTLDLRLLVFKFPDAVVVVAKLQLPPDQLPDMLR